MIQKISYRRGWQQANNEEKKRIMKRLMRLYDVTTVQSVYIYIRGERSPETVSPAAIEKAFAREGIEDIWDKKAKKQVTA